MRQAAHGVHIMCKRHPEMPVLTGTFQDKRTGRVKHVTPPQSTALLGAGETIVAYLRQSMALSA
jgi:hypothetical protein